MFILPYAGGSDLPPWSILVSVPYLPERELIVNVVPIVVLVVLAAILVFVIRRKKS